MLSKKVQDLLVFTFGRILSLNKPELTSLPLVSILLLLKSILGSFFIMAVFFANETAFAQPINIVDKVFALLNYEGDLPGLVFCGGLGFINVLIGILFANLFQRREFQVANRLLLVLFLLLQIGKYFIIIMVCFQIRQQFSKGQIIIGIINSFSLALIILWSLLFQKLYFTLNYSTKNLLARFNLHIHEYTECFFTLATLIMACIGPKNLNNSLQLVFNAIFLFAKAYFIYKGLLKWLYVNRKVQEIYAFFFMIQTVTLLANLIIQLTNQNLLKSNFFVCVAITSIFCFLGWKSYFDWYQQDIYFARGKDIRQPSKATMYLKALHQIVAKNSHHSQSSSLILASIRKQHQIQCKQPSCYCRNSSEDIFIQQYSIQQLQALRIIFKNNPKILIQKLNLRFYMFQSYPDILNRLQQISNHFTLSITEKYSLFSLKTELMRFIDEKNASSNMIDIENPLKLQQVSNNIENIIKKDIEKKSKKWKYLARGMCRIEELQQDTNDEINFLKEITEINNNYIIKFKRSILFNILIMFYNRKISFLNVKNDQIQKNLRELLKKIKEQQLSSTKQFAKWIFHKRSCVIESLVDNEHMGMITRSSKNVHQMFGYSQKKVIGMNLNKLMPNFMAQQHNKIIEDWIKTGTWRTVGKLKQIFCIHKDEMCFSALIYLKIIAHQKGLYFIGVVFKKNESDYLILNQKQQIQGVGRKFVHLMGQNCVKLPMNFICSDFPTLDHSKQQDFKFYVKEFISLNGHESMASQFMEEKNRKFLTDQQEKRFISSYKSKIQNEQVERWQVKFGLKIFRMRQLPFYVLLLNYAKKIQNEEVNSMPNITDNKAEIIVGTGRVNEDQGAEGQSQEGPSNGTIHEGHRDFFDEKNSSMVSFAERENFTLTKLLKVFYEYMIKPTSIKNKRIEILNVSTLLQALMLITLISASFLIYMSSLSEIKSYVQANAQINQLMQLAVSVNSKVVSFPEYEQDLKVMNYFLRSTRQDLSEFHQKLYSHLSNINTAKSQFHSQQLYQYLKSPITYYTDFTNSQQIQVLQFLSNYYYMISQIKTDVTGDVAGNQTLNVLGNMNYELKKIRINLSQLKQVTSSISLKFAGMTQTTKKHLIIAAWTSLVLFFAITLLFFLYTYNYFAFRHTQTKLCLQIYRSVPAHFIEKIKDYYAHFYSSLFSSGSNKSASIQENLQTLNANQLIIDETHTSSLSNNKLKFIGEHKFSAWIRSFVMLLAVNILNAFITYQIISFVEPLGDFITSVNSIIGAENKQIEAYQELKGMYVLSKNNTINVTVIDNILISMTQNEVKFNEMVMFQSQTLSSYDSEFYLEFYNILIDNVCVQIKEMIDQQTFNECMAVSKAGVIEDGIITYMNYFQRKVREALEDLKLRGTMRMVIEGKQYFINRGFKEVDLSISYSIKLFRKLIDRIVIGYGKGIDYMSFMNSVVLVFLITPQIFALIFWFHLTKTQKTKLSFMYGSILMIPPIVIRNVKNLPRMAKKILQYEQN